MRVDPDEFLGLDLRCHSLLSDANLHDVWAIPLAGGGPGRTMEDVRTAAPVDARPSSRAVRGLFALRRALGRVFGWDRESQDPLAESYVNRLTDEDRARSEITPGTPEGAFRMIYRFPREALGEIRNATVHGFLARALVEHGEGYVLYWAIYVKPVGFITRAYMAAIDPFRRVIVYPAVIRQIQVGWSRAYGPGEKDP